MSQELETKIICEKCGRNLAQEDKYCRHCGAKRRVCMRCNHTLQENDRYCSYCGSPSEEREYVPGNYATECIYGPPPVDIRHICRKCGYEWVSCSIWGKSDSGEFYCPKCGSEVEKEEIDPWGSEGWI